MLAIDAERLLMAFDSIVEAMEATAFLNRYTGEILFIYTNEGGAESACGKDEVIEAVFDRGTVEAWPDRYVEIPKYGYGFSQLIEQSQVIRKFFQEHGIEAILV